MNKPQMSETYQALLRQWAELDSKAERTPEEEFELTVLHAALHVLESAHWRASVFETVASDYADLRQVGDLGGTEL